MYRLFIILLFTSYWILPPSADAQQKYKAERLDNSDGLSNSCITSIYQDSDHLLWIGTWDGLNVYDGTSFHVFNYGSGEPNSNLNNNIILQIKEDSQKNIWINTMDGISMYNKGSGKFSHYFYDQNALAKYSKRKSLLFTDQQKNIYCVSKTSSTLYRYDVRLNKFIKLFCEDNSLSKNNILFDDKGHIWTIDDAGVIKGFAVVKNSLIPFKQIADKEKINGIYTANHHLFYTTVNRHLVQLDEKNNRKEIQVPYNVNDILFYNNHYLICWSLKGIGEYDVNLKPTTDIFKNIDELNGTHITSFVSGSEKLLWLGTEGNGLVKIGQNDNRISVMRNLSSTIPNILVRSFLKVNKDLWIGTKGNGLITIKNFGEANEEKPIVNPVFLPAVNTDNSIYAMKNGADNYIYLGSDSPGITVYNSEKKVFIPYHHIGNHEKYSQFSAVHAILPDKDGSVWLGTVTHGLVHLKLKTSTQGTVSIDYLNKYSNTDRQTQIGSDIVYALEQGSRSNIYIGCRFGGLTILNTKNNSFRILRAFSYRGSLSNNDVLSLYLSKNHKLWIGTSYGLDWIDEAELAKPMPIFHSLNTEYGMPNNTIHAITEDDQGNIWVSTNKGLASIDQRNLTIKQFKVSDGLQSNEFCDGAILKSSDNYLFFGGIHGFNFFHPQQLSHNSNPPNLLLSDLQPLGKFGESYKLTVISMDGRFKSPGYQLSRQDNFFELHIKAIKYRNADKCQYAYFLDGYDKAWHYINEDKKIEYANLPPGSYRLKVKWSNGDGVWSNEISALHLEIKQYFWLTLPAIVIYVIILCFAGGLFYKNRRNKMMMMHKLSIEHMTREKDEQMHQEQLKFFTNIAHELQTPLTLISGSLERYSSKQSRSDTNSNRGHFLAIIKQQASRLSYLVYQLLEFRKAEAGHLKINDNYLNVSSLFNNIINLFIPLKEQKKLDLCSQIATDITLWTDKDKLEKIIFNLLSNAFKHISINQKIICSLNIDPQGEQLDIVIANSGCTLSKEQLDQLFTRFFVADANQQSKISSGIGLAFTKELVTIMNGHIGVECVNGWISFKVQLPIYVPSANSMNVNEPVEKSDRPSFLLADLNDNNFIQPNVEHNNQEALFEELINTGKKSILIVEDEPDIRYLLKDMLKDQYVVYEAECGRKALELLSRICPDLIISDIMMPDMSGLEVCNKVKLSPDTCHIPFIILSARDTLEHKTEGYEAGADAYIPKPFSSEYLLVRIRKLLDYRQKLSVLFKQDILTSHLNDTGLNEEDRTFLKSIIACIETNIENEGLNADFIEKKMAVSRANLYRRLKILANMTPGELIIKIRIQNAALLLQSSELTVSEIFYQSGFNNRSHFFREFKKHYQTSPAEYRAGYRLAVG